MNVTKRKPKKESNPLHSCERPADVCTYHTDPIPCAVNLLAPGARPLPLPPDTEHIYTQTYTNINKLPDTLQSECVSECAFVYLVLSPFGHGQMLSPLVRNPLRSPQPSLTTTDKFAPADREIYSIFIYKFYTCKIYMND